MSAEEQAPEKQAADAGETAGVVAGLVSGDPAPVRNLRLVKKSSRLLLVVDM